MDLRALINTINKVGKDTRSGYHLTLGALRDVLVEAPSEWLVEFDDGTPVGTPHSYRGYYSDLAFKDASIPRKVAEVYPGVLGAIGREFTGYKGGEYRMHEKTPLWRSEYGSASGIAVVRALAMDGKIVLVTQQVD
jgi:hypothetical protein